MLEFIESGAHDNQHPNKAHQAGKENVFANFFF